LLAIFGLLYHGIGTLHLSIPSDQSVDWIVVAVAEEIVVAGVEQLRGPVPFGNHSPATVLPLNREPQPAVSTFSNRSELTRV